MLVVSAEKPTSVGQVQVWARLALPDALRQESQFTVSQLGAVLIILQRAFHFFWQVKTICAGIETVLWKEGTIACRKLTVQLTVSEASVSSVPQMDFLAETSLWSCWTLPVWTTCPARVSQYAVLWSPSLLGEYGRRPRSLWRWKSVC